METEPSVLARIEFVLSQSTNPDQSAQQSCYSELESLSARPDFLPSLLLLIDRDSNGSAVLAASLMRHYLKLASPEMVKWVAEAAGPVFVRCFSKSLPLVRQVATLAATFYEVFQIAVVGDVGQLCVNLLKEPSTVGNALWIAYEMAPSGVDLGCEFVSCLHNFLLTEHRDVVMRIAKFMLPMHEAAIKETILPLAFQHVREFSDEGLKDLVQMVGHVVEQDQSQVFIDFLVKALECNEMVALAAAKVFRVNTAIPFQPNAVKILFTRLGEEENIHCYNISYASLMTIRQLVVNHQEARQALMSLILAGFADQATRVNSILALAVVQEMLDGEDLRKVWDSVLPHLESPAKTSASYCIANIGMFHSEYREMALEALFKLLVQSPSEVRIQVEANLSLLVAYLDGIPSEPYLGLLLEVMKRVEPDELISMFFLLGNFCQAVSSFEGDPHVKDLIDLGVKAFKEDNALFIGAIHLFGNLLIKCPSLFMSIFELTSGTILNCLNSLDEEHSLYLWVWKFLQNAVVGSAATGANINSMLIAVCEKLPAFLTFPNNAYVRQHAWSFVLALWETKNMEVCSAIVTSLMTIIINTRDDEDLQVVGKIAEVLYFILDFFQGKLESPLAIRLTNVMAEGYRYSVGDDNVDRQNIACTMLKLFSVDQRLNFEAALVQDLMQTLCAMPNSVKKSESQEFFKLLFAKQAASR